MDLNTKRQRFSPGTLVQNMVSASSLVHSRGNSMSAWQIWEFLFLRNFHGSSRPELAISAADCGQCEHCSQSLSKTSLGAGLPGG